MSRNGSGTYSLPAGNPVVTGTTITSTWANNTLTDIANTLTSSVASDGQTPMTGNLNMATNKITALGTPTLSTDAVTKAYADALIAGGGAGLFTSVTDSGLTANRVTYATTAGLLTDSANMTFNGTGLTLANDATISGLTVGKGGGSVAANTVFGKNAGYTNTTGYISAFGWNAVASNTTGVDNAGFGLQALNLNTTGTSNSSFGHYALNLNTTGSNNTALGSSALFSNTTASYNTAVGYQAGYYSTGSTGAYFGGYAGNVCTGTRNTFLGYSSGSTVTSGNYNTVLGGYNGNQGGLDIRTASNYLVLSDGEGNPRIYHNGTTVVIPNLPTSATGLPTGGLWKDASGFLKVA